MQVPITPAVGGGVGSQMPRTTPTGTDQWYLRSPFPSPVPRPANTNKSEAPPDSALLMAAATMHQMGRLRPTEPGFNPKDPRHKVKPKETGVPQADEQHPEFTMGGIRG